MTTAQTFVENILNQQQKKSKWLGRSLGNYIDMHRKQHPDVVTAKTLTQARKICFGDKPKRAFQREQLLTEWKEKGSVGGPDRNPVLGFTSNKRSK